MGKAMDIYNRTKSKPTKSGIHAAKQINHRLIHPIFADKIGKKELKTYQMMNNISTFKPYTTVFEVGGASNPNYNMMQMTRNRFNKQTNKSSTNKKVKTTQKQQKKQNMTTKYRDSEYFIESESKEVANEKFVEDMLMINNNDSDELRQFIMELDDDERQAINTKKKLYRYNANSRKYVTEYMGDRINRFMTEKNESSKNINTSKHEYGKLYKEWTLKSKREIAINGSYEKQDVNTNNNLLMGLRKHRHIKGSNQYYQNQRSHKKIQAMRKEKVLKEKSKKDKI